MNEFISIFRFYLSWLLISTLIIFISTNLIADESFESNQINLSESNFEDLWSVAVEMKPSYENFSVYQIMLAIQDLNKSAFEKNNIKQIDSLNKKLDPNFHQAMMEIEDDTKEPGTIIQEIQKGFTIKDRLLRPSLVGVSKKIATKEEKTEENQANPENK